MKTMEPIMITKQNKFRTLTKIQFIKVEIVTPQDVTTT